MNNQPFSTLNKSYSFSAPYKIDGLLSLSMFVIGCMLLILLTVSFNTNDSSAQALTKSGAGTVLNPPNDTIIAPPINPGPGDGDNETDPIPNPGPNPAPNPGPGEGDNETDPDPTEDPPDPDENLGIFQQEMLVAVNSARSSSRNCGSIFYPAAGMVKWSELVEDATIIHSSDMSNTGNLSHIGSDGSNPGNRLSEVGYNWREYGENIASGFQSINDVIQAWLNSPGHCDNIMNPEWIEMGASEIDTYWTLLFTIPTNVDPDDDGDGVEIGDNCPGSFNPDQIDTDGDGMGDVCDDDDDNDGKLDVADNCPDDPNDGQEDFDEDGIGDVCEFCDCNDPDAIVDGFSFRGRTIFFGTNGGDIICGTNGRDVIFAFGGNDCVDAAGGNDRVFAGFGHDIVDLGLGHDRAWGGRGDDDIDGEDGFDRINGGRGFDACFGESLRRCE